MGSFILACKQDFFPIFTKLREHTGFLDVCHSRDALERVACVIHYITYNLFKFTINLAQKAGVV